MMTRTLLAGVAAATVAVSAGAANIASTGTASTGHTEDLAAGLGTARNHIGGAVDDAVAANTRLTDGDTTVTPGTTTVDTWNNVAGGTYDFIQVLFAGSVNNIDQVTLHGVSFPDGGWFGINDVDSVAIADLEVPTVQVTSDGGANWTDVAATSDYLAQVNAAGLPGSPVGWVATFDFAAQSGIDGIRLVGTPGGSAAGGAQGFIGATEIEVNQIPEPGSLALIGLGGLLIARRRRG